MTTMNKTREGVYVPLATDRRNLQPNNPVPRHYRKRRAAMDWWMARTAGNRRQRDRGWGFWR